MSRDWKIILGTGLFAIVLLGIEHILWSKPPAFSLGQHVRLTRSGKFLATQDGGPAWMDGGGWWRFVVVRNEGDGWVKIRPVDGQNFVRYAEASRLSKGWMTIEQYVSTYDQAELQRMRERQKELTAKVQLPSNAQLEKDAQAIGYKGSIFGVTKSGHS